MESLCDRAQVLDLGDARPLVRAALERARRYRRSLALVVMRDVDLPSRSDVRPTDLVVDLEGGRLMIVAEDADAESAGELLRRLGVPPGVAVGRATFPDDGPGMEALLLAAQATAPVGARARA